MLLDFIVVIIAGAVMLLSKILFCSKYGGFCNGKVGGASSSRRNNADVVKNLKLNPRSKSEAAVIAELEQLTGAKFPTINPSWLVWYGKTLELDGYCEDKKLALEFSGPLHTKWTPAYEAYPKYYSRIVKDVVKRRTCKQRGVYLIVIDMSLPKHRWREYLKSRLWDAGQWPNKPEPYHTEQIIEPFRNPHLEIEYNLQDMTAARSIPTHKKHH